MLKPGDLIILILFILILLIFVLYKSSRLLTRPLGRTGSSSIPKSGDVLNMLEEHGYEMTSGKTKIPIQIRVDDKTYQSRLFMDGFAQKNGQLYVVRVGNSRKPLRLAGASIRDELLSYYLLYRTEGILYLDLERNRLREVNFVVESQSIHRTFRWWPYLLSMVFGAWIASRWLQ